MTSHEADVSVCGWRVSSGTFVPSGSQEESHGHSFTWSGAGPVSTFLWALQKAADDGGFFNRCSRERVVWGGS